jgi:hypothetical protein
LASAAEHAGDLDAWLLLVCAYFEFAAGDDGRDAGWATSLASAAEHAGAVVILL